MIGRKNWLFSGSPKGAEASAGIYTLVETAKANGLAPMKYIKYILSDMPGSAFLEHPEYLDDYLPSGTSCPASDLLTESSFRIINARFSDSANTEIFLLMIQ